MSNLGRAIREIKTALQVAQTSAPGIHFTVEDKGHLHAHIDHGIECPPEVEALCDIITRARGDGSREYLKLLDGPLP